MLRECVVARREQSRFTRSLLRPKTSINLVGAYLCKAAHPAGATRIQHLPSTLDIRAYERHGVFNAPVYVSFGSKVDYHAAVFSDLRKNGINAFKLPGLSFTTAVGPWFGGAKKD